LLSTVCKRCQIFEDIFLDTATPETAQVLGTAAADQLDSLPRMARDTRRSATQALAALPALLWGYIVALWVLVRPKLRLQTRVRGSRVLVLPLDAPFVVLGCPALIMSAFCVAEYNPGSAYSARKATHFLRSMFTKEDGRDYRERDREDRAHDSGGGRQDFGEVD